MSRAAQRRQARAEVMKLARLLGREPAELAHLERVAAADVRRLRDTVTELLYDADAGVLGRMADYVTMGRFVAHLSPDALAAALHQIDDAALLEVALVTEDSERLHGVEATLSDPALQARIAQLRAHGVSS